jgi:putative GTP pyrophosphokinase
MKKIWISLLNTDCYIRNDIKERKHGMIIDELKKQGKALLDARRDNFVRQSLLSNEFLNFMQQNKKPFDLLMSYYECAIMEIETKFRVLNHELSLEYDNNPIESIKTRVKSYDSILKKIRRKNIPLNLQAIEENLKDIAGVRVICSFPDDIYKLAESFLKQDDITLIERKDYIKNPKPSGYRSLHLIVQVPIFLQNEKKMVNVEVQFRTIAMDFWASLDHKMRYKKELSDEEVEILQEELYDCAEQSAALDERMQRIRDRITQKREKEAILLEDQHDKC